MIRYLYLGEEAAYQLDKELSDKYPKSVAYIYSQLGIISMSFTSAKELRRSTLHQRVATQYQASEYSLLDGLLGHGRLL